MASIIVAINNSFPLVSNFMDQLLACVRRQDEIIVVADGSFDQRAMLYLEKLACNDDIRLLKNEHRRGFSVSNNLGASVATGDSLIFINSDVFPQEGCFDSMLETLWSNDKVGAVQPLLIFPQNNLVQSTGHLFVDYESHQVFQHRDPLDPIVQTAGRRQALTLALCAMKASVFHELGGLDEYYVNSHEGMELTLKVTLNGYDCLYDPRAIAYHCTKAARSQIVYDSDRQKTHFYIKWSDKISIDIVKYLQMQITNSDLEKRYCVINFSRSRIWETVVKHLEIKTTNFIDSEAKYTPTTNLYSWLPVDFLRMPTPYLFLCNDINQLKENYNWCIVRNNPDDLIMDLNGNVLHLLDYVTKK